MIHIDTHAAIWLYEGTLDRFTNKGKSLLEENQIIISPMAVLELEFLNEIKRIKVSSTIIINELQKSINLHISEAKFIEIINISRTYNWTRDPFDRLIVANAAIDTAPLLTKDKHVHKMCDCAVW